MGVHSVVVSAAALRRSHLPKDAETEHPPQLREVTFAIALFSRLQGP